MSETATAAGSGANATATFARKVLLSLFRFGFRLIYRITHNFFIYFDH